MDFLRILGIGRKLWRSYLLRWRHRGFKGRAARCSQVPAGLLWRTSLLSIVRYVCKDAGWPHTCLTDWFGDEVEAWKIAGLPNPGEEEIRFRSWNPLGY